MREIIVILVLALLRVTTAWYENCDYMAEVTASTSMVIVTANYPGSYQPGSSCKWYLSAPVGYTVELTCTFDLKLVDTDCSSQRLFVSREGDKNLNYAEFHCGYSSFTRYSVGNEISLGYTSNSDGDGWLYCQANAVKTTQENCQCGWSKAGRIVGGSVAKPNEFVSMVGLVDVSMRNDPHGPIFCGAAIISENFALTAAHCFNDARTLSNIYLLVGDHDIAKGDETPYTKLYQSSGVIIHGGYIPESDDQNNDIALVKTLEPIAWKKTIGPACLPFVYDGYDEYFDGYQLTAVGWGSVEFAGPTSQVLKKTSLTVIKSSTCNETYSDINNGKICTYSQGTDTCQRDSGGSLYWAYGGRQYTIGVVSYGRDCASKYPSVNTRVTRYLEWIEGHVVGGGGFLCEK